MKHRFSIALADYDWWLFSIKADNYWFVPVGIAATILMALCGLWILCQSRDLQCLALVLICSFFARPLPKRGGK